MLGSHGACFRRTCAPPFPQNFPWRTPLRRPQSVCSVLMPAARCPPRPPARLPTSSIRPPANYYGYRRCAAAKERSAVQLFEDEE